MWCEKTQRDLDGCGHVCNLPPTGKRADMSRQDGGSRKDLAGGHLEFGACEQEGGVPEGARAAAWISSFISV